MSTSLRPCARRALRACILGMLAVVLIAGEAPSAAGWEALKAGHVDALVAFASAGGDNKAGSLELDLRQEAIAVARRIDGKSAKLKNLFARKRAMTPDEATADRALRATVAARDQARLAAEAAAKEVAATPPVAETPAEELEHLRHRILQQELAYALAISLDPDDQPLVVLRKGILIQIKAILGQTRWGWEKQVKDRIEIGLAAKYEPWNATWKCGEDGWGELTLSQNGGEVKGRWAEGSLTAQVKGRYLEGTWQSASAAGRKDKGTFTFTLGDSDQVFDARVNGEVGVARHWNALRKDFAESLVTTTVTEEPEKPADAPAEKPVDKPAEKPAP
jgi:hypothetical protein